MKKYLFVLVFCVLVMPFDLMAQSRTNAPKPQFLPEKSSILSSAVGWAYNTSIGEWIDYKNVITAEKSYKTEWASLQNTPAMLSREDQNFISMQSRKFSYENENYYLLVIKQYVGWYKYPSIYSGWEYAEDMVGYIFSIDEYNKLKNINGLVSLKAIGGAGGGAGRKYDDAAMLDSIQEILNKRKSPKEERLFPKMEHHSIFPVLKSEEGNIRFYIPEYVMTTDSKGNNIPDKEIFYNKPYNFNERYFEVSFDDFSKLIIQ